ncbi:SET domain-containing protein SmydA-8-like [Scaptodrosophila lebanonensis]|uniref:SET domain-containing protein SmydA-8-like n=1 Tax=Drosophila lebanonensis TaxID=7225 RepID=A0A6J2TVW2_DROLE|nr:SET domain-containing protein SmydA-8-like [Scaptodrosophila lebanonensis]
MSNGRASVPDGVKISNGLTPQKDNHYPSAMSQGVQQMSISASTQELAELIDVHLGELRPESPAWRVSDSPISGRGIFAVRDIVKGEELFREHTLLVGPTAHRSTNLRTCTLCYRLVPGEDDTDAMCPAGCGLPVCPECAVSERHANECKLFRKWEPKELGHIEPRALRILSVVRCFFLNEAQRRLLYAMQANADKYYMKEVERAAGCFEHFPHEQDMLDYFYRTICAFNTNAFESRSRVEGHEVLVRALFPLAGLLNHQCTPNASHHFEDAETIVVTAAERIPQGAEITMSYTKVLWSTLARKMFLGMTKHFMCHCPRCEDPTPQPSSSPSPSPSPTLSSRASHVADRKQSCTYEYIAHTPHVRSTLLQ